MMKPPRCSCLRCSTTDRSIALTRSRDQGEPAIPRRRDQEGGLEGQGKEACGKEARDKEACGEEAAAKKPVTKKPAAKKAAAKKSAAKKAKPAKAKPKAKKRKRPPINSSEAPRTC